MLVNRIPGAALSQGSFGPTVIDSCMTDRRPLLENIPAMGGRLMLKSR
jgi:hypothetical protein